MKSLSQNIVFFLGVLMVWAQPLAQAKPSSSYTKDLAQIHKTVYQKSFAEKDLRQALSKIGQRLAQKPSAELHLYQSMAHYRLQEYIQAFLAARKGLDLQKKVIAHLNKKDPMYGYQKTVFDELETLRDRAQARLELDIYKQKLKSGQKKEKGDLKSTGKNTKDKPSR